MTTLGGLLCAGGCRSFQGFEVRKNENTRARREHSAERAPLHNTESARRSDVPGPRFEDEPDDRASGQADRKSVRQVQYQSSTDSRGLPKLLAPDFSEQPPDSPNGQSFLPPGRRRKSLPTTSPWNEGRIPRRVSPTALLQSAVQTPLPGPQRDPIAPLAPSKIRIPQLKIPDRPQLDPGKYPFLFADPLGDGPVSDGAFAPDRVQPVSLNECVLFALQNNPDIHVSQFAVPTAGEEIPLQESIFDPVFRLGSQWSRTDQQVLSTIEGNGISSGGVATDSFGPPQGLLEQLALSKQFETGGFFEAGWETAYTFTEPAGNFLTLNPSQRSRMNFRLEQPLFRGAGQDVNLAGIGIARANHRASIHDFEANVNQLIRDIQVAYWHLYHSKANVDANENFVTEARVTWQKEVSKRGLGASSLPQVAQAREQYERFRQELARSRRRCLTAERTLKQLLGMPGATEFRVIPDQKPLTDFVDVHWEAALSEALVNRPEIASQRESIRTAEIDYEKATNGLCPDVTAYANYSLSGVGRNFHESANTVLDNRFQDWTLGFRYERAFGRRFDQASEQQSAIQLMQERAQLRSVEHSVEHELRAAYDKLVTASELVNTLENQLAAAGVQVDANRVLYDSGQISLDLFLRTQNVYAEALRQKEQVFVEYTQALAEWDYAKGTIMRTADVTITDKLPEPEWD